MTGSNPLAHGRILPANTATIKMAASLLRRGDIVAIPTETVYGLAANAADAESVAAIYRAKGRPDFNPLITHIPDVQAGESLAVFDDRTHALAQAFWPGPLTMVLPLRKNAPIATAVTAGLPTIALRCPEHGVMQAILRESGLFLAAPSANRSGGISPTRAHHVEHSLGDAVPLILDGGPCATGLESTIIALRENAWQILRAGPVTTEQIISVLGTAPIPVSADKIEAPGQLASHYAPDKPLRLNADAAGPDEWFIGFGNIDGDDNLSPEGDLAVAAAHLYDALHRGDASDRAGIAIAPIPENAVGAAIADRLTRAAARA